jgi:hypothetical protein
MSKAKPDAGARGPTRRTLVKGGVVAGWAVPLAGLGPRGAPLLDDPKDVLRALLARNHEMRPDFFHGLSNHVSMGLYSLDALGGGAAQMRAFFAETWPSLEPLPTAPGPDVTPETWTSLLGRRDALPGFRRLFAAELAARGTAEVLRRTLPTLLPGVATGLFHALIRTGYGVRFGDQTEVADGLSYWATAYAPLAPLPPPGREAEPDALLGRLHDGQQLARRYLAGRNLYEKMRAASALAGFNEVVGALKVTPATFPRLAATALRLYVATRDFSALHMVTATHAIRQLLPFVDSEPRAVQQLWQAYVAAYVVMGTPAFASPGGGEPPTWTELARKAAASTDAHDLKLVDIAREEESVHREREPLYRRAAARRLGLV